MYGMVIAIRTVLLVFEASCLLAFILGYRIIATFAVTTCQYDYFSHNLSNEVLLPTQSPL